jgi:hypothetical protein
MLRDLAKIKEDLAAAAGTGATTESVSVTGVSAEVSAARSAQGKVLSPEPVSLLSARLAVPIGLAGLVLGAVLGYLGRTEDLLRSEAVQAEGPPGLWIAPWESVPTKASPEDQYHYAQLVAPEAEREAAWLAVPGRFPRSHEWSSRAQAQLVRTLFRHRDAERLDGFAAELARSERAHDHHLGRVARAAAAALREDTEELIDQLDDLDAARLDPALAEIALEATLRALRRTTGPSNLEAQLRKQRNALVNALQLQFLPPKMIGLG